MSILEDIGRRLKGWPVFFIAPAVAGLLGYLFLRLKTIIIPDWVFLVLIVGLWVVVLYVFWYIRHNEKKAASSKWVNKEPKPTKEVLFILRTLAERHCDYVTKGGLVVLYEQNFKGQEKDEFTAAIRTLHGAGLVQYYALDSDKLALSDKGSTYYLEHKSRLLKDKK